jgi:hypothetical protein
MLIFSLVVSLVLTSVVLLVTKGRGLAVAGGLLMAAGVCGLFLPCLPVIFPAIPLSGLLLLIASLAGQKTTGQRRQWTRAFMAILAGHAAVQVYSLFVIKQRAELRANYPVESMAERLAYERSPSSGDPTPALKDPAALDSVEREVEAKQSFGLSRAWSLKKLHQGVLADFIEAPGFGVGRVIADATKEFIELRDAPRIPQPGPATESNPEEVDSDVGDLALVPEAPAKGDLEALHAFSALEFVNPRGFGYVMDRKQVMGFQPHRFEDAPELSSSQRATQRWQVQRVELVSLLKHDEPGVYLSEYLPRMEQLREAKTRPLNAFETKALRALRNGEDIEFAATTNSIHMLGAIRAVKQCLNCHQAERGALLGTFSYTLHREPPLYVPKP